MKLDRVIAIRNTKTIYRDGDRCVKVFNGNYSKVDILNEALGQARVEEMGLHVPKILEVTTIEGKWAIVSEFIKGKTLAQLMQENLDKKPEYLEQFVDIQLTIHAKTCPLLNRLQDKLDHQINRADLDTATRDALQTKLTEMPKHNKVCHGDFNPSNIVISEDNTPYILDWSHVTQGNASADAAETYLLFRLNGDMDSAQAYLDLYCQMSHTEKRYVQQWLSIVAAAQSVKGNKTKREFLLSWVAAMNDK